MNYGRRNRVQTMTLAEGEFIRRFLLYGLPPDSNIRHDGWLSNRRQKESSSCAAGCWAWPATISCRGPAQFRDLYEKLTGAASSAARAAAARS